MKIYVASSWRTSRHNEVVEALRQAGHEVYDYRKPNGKASGFTWEELDPEWQKWTASAYDTALASGKANEAFWRDMSALQGADVVVGVQPFGVSAALEMGWAAGHGKTTILINEDMPKPELMTKMIQVRLSSIEPVIALLKTQEAFQ